jgi:hypothetical protein
MQGLQLAGGFGDEQANFPVLFVESEGNWLTVLGAQTAMRAENQKLGIERAIGGQPMPAFWIRPKRLPDGSVSSISAESGNSPAGPAACVATLRRLGSEVSSIEVNVVVAMGVPFPSQVYRGTPD